MEIQTLDAVARFHRTLVEEILRSRPTYLSEPFTVAEIYQNLVPYRTHRDRIGIEMNGDYEDALLRLLAGEGEFLILDSEHAVREIREELHTSNPNTGLYRAFAAADVRLNPLRMPRDLPDPVRGPAVGPTVPAPAATPTVPASAPSAPSPAPQPSPTPPVAAAPPPTVRRETTPPAMTEAPAKPAASTPTSKPPASTAAAKLSAPPPPVSVPTPKPVAPPMATPAPTPAPTPVSGASAPAAPPPKPAATPLTAPENGKHKTVRAAAAASKEPTSRAEAPKDATSGAHPSKCAWCREPLPRNRAVLNFCPFCGANMHTVPCATCGEELEVEWRFCVACGTSAGERG